MRQGLPTPSIAGYLIALAALAGTGAANDVESTWYGTSAGQGGMYNARYGYEAGKAAVAGVTSNENSLFGASVGLSLTSEENTVFGYSAGRDMAATTQYGTFLGMEAGKNNSGRKNTFLGYQSGLSNGSGYENTFVGSFSGKTNTSGHNNVFFGHRAGEINQSGSYNVFFGYAAGQYTLNADRNLFLGSLAGNNSQGSDNTCIGNETCSANGYPVDDVLVGYRTGKTVTGSHNLMLGAEAGYNRGGGYDNTFIGYQAGYSGTYNEGNVFIGSGAGYSEMGYYKFYVANKSTGTPLMKGDFNTGEVEIQSYAATQGCDLAEHFQVIEGAAGIRPGMLVSIASDQDGKMRIATAAYDRALAGVISGAGGVSPGLSFKPGAFPGKAKTYPVALTGRVYCLADASRGAIRPGDLLTSSDVPGHAMKVADKRRAGRAIFGKALSSLENGRGLVLALIGD